MYNGSFGLLKQNNFKAIRTAFELSNFLRVPVTELERLINEPPYEYFTIDKKKGGQRQIQAPLGQLKSIQRKLNKCLQQKYNEVNPGMVYGFVTNPNATIKQCNIALNASHHVGKKVLLNLDLKDFFSSISASRVKSLFIAKYFEFPEEIATALALLCTYRGQLPTGSPCSPVLSNFICLELDHSLQAFSQRNGLFYTRYADDLSFSSDQAIERSTIEALRQIIVQNGFQINDKKFRLRTANRKQIVTGIIVNEKVNIDRRFLKKTRAMLHDLQTNGLQRATQRHYGGSALNAQLKDLFLSRLRAYISFIGQVRGEQDPTFLKMKATFHQVNFTDK